MKIIEDVVEGAEVDTFQDLLSHLDHHGEVPNLDHQVLVATEGFILL